MANLTVTESVFGTLPDGRSIRRFDLANGTMTASLLEYVYVGLAPSVGSIYSPGLYIKLSTLAHSYGATLLSVRTPDCHGVLEEVTLNRDTVDGLLNKNAYYGSTVGRVANRIANAEFVLEGQVRAY